MKNLIAMDLYRLFRTKALKVGIVAAFLVSLLTVLFNFALVELVKPVVLNTGAEELALMSIMAPSVGWILGVDFADVVISGTGAFSLLICCVVASSFISGEQACGYVKNVMGQLTHRGYSVISKFVVTSVVHLIILSIYTLVNAVMGKVLFANYITGCSVGNMVGALLTRLLLYVAINAIIVFLCILTKSQSLGMVIGAVFGIGVTQIVYMVANGLLGMLKIKINVAHLMPDGVNGLINAADIGSLYGRAIGVSAVVIVVFLTASVLVVRNRDVR